MPDPELTDAVRGHTIRFTWMGGPTEGKTHEHVFHADGTVEWRDAGTPEKPQLTVVLNFQDRSIVGFASGAKEWYPLRGRLEVVG